jgi:N-acetylneuraminic acid mutarotase
MKIIQQLWSSLLRSELIGQLTNPPAGASISWSSLPRGSFLIPLVLVCFGLSTAPTASPTPTATATPAACSWAPGPSMPSPGVRFAGVYFPSNGKFYAIGGRDLNNFEFTNPFEYDPGSNSWTTKSAAYPDSHVSNIACAVLNDNGTDYIYCVGGSEFATFTTTARVFRYDPVADSIRTIPSGWPPGHHNILPGGFSVFNNKLYILGGYNISVSMDDGIWEFTPSPAGWVQKAAVLPVPLGYIPQCTIGNFIYTGGGSMFDPSVILVPTTNSFKYDPTADSITTIANIPRATDNTRGLNFGNQLWVIGGDDTTYPNPTNEVDVYDPVSNTWSLGQPMNTARSNFATDTDGTNNIWVAGGYDSTIAATDSMEIFNCTSTCLLPPAGLVSWWSGDKTAEDVQGTNNGTLLNGTSFRKGMVGPAFSFDGVDDYVQVPHNSSLNPGTGDFSVDFWMKTDTAADMAVLSKREACGPVSFWNFFTGADGTFAVEIRQTGENNVNSFNSDISVIDGTWHHVAVVRQTTTVTLYIDGVVHGSSSTEGITMVANTAPVLFGNDACVCCGRQVYSGELDEIQYLDVALTSSQVQDIYNAGAAGQCKPEIFVSSIDPSYSVVHSQFLVATSVSIQDTNGIGSAGAAVNVKTLFPNGSELVFPAVTDENGNANISFYTGESGLYKFKIQRVNLPGRIYDASLNIETSDTLVIP